VFCVAAFIALAHAMRFSRRNAFYAPGPAQAGAAYLTAVSVKSRGRVSMVDLASVAWIETQGNYLALHAGTDVHLIREASVKFEARLDPERFVRIHRRIIVAVDRVRDIAALTNGDATLRLDDGTELRMSRSFRENFRAKFEARALKV
jgi:two-component system, LytTR family, response regulator